MYPKKKFDAGNRFGGRKDFGRSPLYSATCVQCGNDCEVPFKPMGNRPVFCRDCFKNQDGGASMGPKKWESRGADDRLMYPAECDTCHNECKVPFRPTQGRPVYCHRCMAAQNGGPSFEPAPERSFGPALGSKMSEEQFKILNAKMDKILKILELATGDLDDEMEDEEEEVFEKLEDIVETKPAAKKKTRGQTKRAKRTGKA